MRTVILHGHIFKNAGTTFDWSLQRAFGAGFLDHRDNDAMLAQGGAYLVELLRANPGLQAVSSHHLPLLSSVPGDLCLLPVYLLRHPLLRIPSVYEFERRQDAATPGARAAKTMSFPDYVAWRMRPETSPVIRDYQTRYLAGVHTFPPEVVSRYRLFLAAMRVAERAPLIGLVERYDETMVLLEERLAVYFPGIDLAYVAQNVSGTSEPAALSDEQIAGQALGRLGTMQKQVLDCNCYDLALYAAVQELFESRLARIDRLSEKLTAFRQRCQRLHNG